MSNNFNLVNDVNDMYFGDINKWSPADIYFASNKARDKIQKVVDINSNKTGFIFSSLNILMSDLIEQGQLLPLSLKKQTREVVLLPVNFSRQEELKTISKFNRTISPLKKLYTAEQSQLKQEFKQIVFTSAEFIKDQRKKYKESY